LHLAGIYMTSITKMHGTMNIKFICSTLPQRNTASIRV